MTTIHVALYTSEHIVSDTREAGERYSGYVRRHSTLSKVIATIGPIPGIGHTYYDRRESFEVEWEPRPGDMVCVLIEEYEDGGTFGCNTYFDIKGVYRTPKKAAKAQSKMTKQSGHFTSHRGYKIELVVLGSAEGAAFADDDEDDEDDDD